MMVSTVLEEIPSTTALENMASRLADRIRNLWLIHHGAKRESWEENIFEDSDGIAFLRSESFPRLQGIDYIFRWWGTANTDADSPAGQLDVIWKVQAGGKVDLYKTWIRFNDQDFILGLISDETEKRILFRGKMISAFKGWQELYLARMNAGRE